MVTGTMITRLDSTDSASLKQMAQATKVLSKVAEKAEKQMASGINIKPNSAMEKLIQTGAVTLASNTLSGIAKTEFGSAGGSAAGTTASSAVSSAVTGAVSGGMVAGIRGAVGGAVLGGIAGLISGGVQTLQNQDDVFKAWYKNLHETAGAGTEGMLASGKMLAAGELGEKQADWETMQAELNLALSSYEANQRAEAAQGHRQPAVCDETQKISPSTWRDLTKQGNQPANNNGTKTNAEYSF